MPSDFDILFLLTLSICFLNGLINDHFNFDARIPKYLLSISNTGNLVHLNFETMQYNQCNYIEVWEDVYFEMLKYGKMLMLRLKKDLRLLILFKFKMNIIPISK